jgi:alkylhydroperoxidase family enzyme
VQLLRASSKHTGEAVSLAAAMTGSSTGDGGVPNGRLLMAFAEAVIAGDASAIAAARADLLAAIGPAGLVDAAAVAGLFNAIDRVADATGTPLEDWKSQTTEDFRREIGIDGFAAAKEALDRPPTPR